MRDGIIISGDGGVVTEIPFLLKNQWLAPTQYLKLNNIVLYFWQNGNLALHSTCYDPPLGPDAFWSSSYHGHTSDTYSDSVRFDNNGSFTMYKDNKVIWQFKTGDPSVNLLFLTKPGGKGIGFGLAHISDADMDRILNNDVNYYQDNIEAILQRSKSYYVQNTD